MEQTVEQYLKEFLTANGLWDDEADKVFEIFKTESVNHDQSMANRFGDPVKDYIEPIKRIWLIHLKDCAVRWIEENAPEHWAKFMFE